MRPFSLPAFALLALAALPAAAQDSGGVNLLPSAVGGPVGLARPMRVTFPSITAADLQAAAQPDAQQRRQQHQDLIARVRGDGGFLEGFSQGQPLALSRQRAPAQVAPESAVFAPTIIRQRNIRVVNRFEAPVSVVNGNGNVVQQQGGARSGGGGSGGGAVAQQQVLTIGGGAEQGGVPVAGAGNRVRRDGSIRQSAAGAVNLAGSGQRQGPRQPPTHLATR